eukprot:scaffold327_cov257-Pinguiococcus_pyrenoidosus.AAC.5
MIAPSRMSRLGRCGRKSFPTKKQRKTKSSTRRSKSKGKGSTPGKLSAPNSSLRYSRSTGMRSIWSGFMVTTSECGRPWQGSMPCIASYPACLAFCSRSAASLFALPNSTCSRRMVKSTS